MRIGILPDRIYKRSVERIIHKYNKDRGAAGENTGCALLCTKTARLSKESRLGLFEIQMIMEELWLEGSLAAAEKPAKLQAIIVLSELTEEPELRELITNIVTVSKELDLHIDSVLVRTERDISCTHIVFSLLADKKNEEPSEGKKGENKAIVQIGFAGEGARYLANLKEQELTSRYSKAYIRKICEVNTEPDRFNQLTAMMNILKKNGKSFVVGEGGIFAGLWRVGEDQKSGFCVEQHSILFRQEIIEACNFFDINPYMLYCGNTILTVTPDSNNLISELAGIGVRSSEIGCLTSDNDRVIINGEEKRFLTEPVADEIYKLM